MHFVKNVLGLKNAAFLPKYPAHEVDVFLAKLLLKEFDAENMEAFPN